MVILLIPANSGTATFSGKTTAECILPGMSQKRSAADKGRALTMCSNRRKNAQSYGRIEFIKVVSTLSIVG